ncbi:MAG: outer membrane protein [Bosea sp. (in: a-proteobacteria)]
MAKYRLSQAALVQLTLILLGAPLTHAADLPLRGSLPEAPVPMARATSSWSGGYVGLTGGGVFGSETKTKTTGSAGFLTLAPNFVPRELNTGKNGFIFGAHAGFNQQIGEFVIGAEADIGWADAKKTAAFSGAVTPLATALTTSATSELKYLGTLRGRLGYAPSSQLHVYATGGLAFGDASVTSSVVANAAPALRWDGKKSDMLFGFAIGAGAEYALTPNIILRGEYLYYDLGDLKSGAFGNAAVRGVGALNGVDYLSETRFNGSLGRAAVSYKF